MLRLFLPASWNFGSDRGSFSFMLPEISGIRPVPGVTLSPFLAVRPAPWPPSGPLRFYTGAKEEN